MVFSIMYFILTHISK